MYQPPRYTRLLSADKFYWIFSIWYLKKMRILSQRTCLWYRIEICFSPVSILDSGYESNSGRFCMKAYTLLNHDVTLRSDSNSGCSDLTCHLSLFAAGSFDISDVLALAAPCSLLRHLKKSIVINSTMTISNVILCYRKRYWKIQ